MIGWMVLLACSKPAPTHTATDAGAGLVLRGGTVVGLGEADVWLRDGRIEAVGEVEEGPEEVDVSGLYLAPAFIDSHVHLAYYEVADALADAGVAAAVDWAAPLSWLDDRAPLPRVLASGPMITAVGGYPTQSWGSGGYGLEVADAEAAEAAVAQLLDAGADVLKVPLTGSARLDAEALEAVLAAAGEVPVGVHALGEDDVQQAADAGFTLLVHTPTEALDPLLVDHFADGAVISTVAAFGGGADAVLNLGALHEAGATVLYGTDLGNSRTVGIQARELALLESAGLTGAEILAAGTSTPAAFWGLDDLGAIEVGKEGSLLVLDADPTVTPATLAEPVQVYLAGERRGE